MRWRSMPRTQGMFGALPPTDAGRALRSAPGQGSGADYIYTYCAPYYRDDTKLTGWNNLAFPTSACARAVGTAGSAKAVFAEEKDRHDPARRCMSQGLRADQPRTMNQEEYNLAVADLVAS